MGTEEAIDLIRSLPDGSAWATSVSPLRSWDERRHRDADLLDAVNVLVWYLALDKKIVPSPPMVVRPRDVMARRREAENNRRVKAQLESDGWEEV